MENIKNTEDIKKPQKNEDAIEWQDYEYVYYEKTPDWYWGVGIITASIFIAVIIFGNIILGILVLLSGFSISLLGSRKPKKISFRIDQDGIQIGREFHFHKEIKLFEISERANKKYLILELNKPMSLQAFIPLENTDNQKIKDFLSRKIEEGEIEESLSEIVSKILRF